MTENGDPLHPRPAVEVVSESRSFILESDAISYVLRARRGDRDVARFPMTDDGLDSAIDEFDRRTRMDWRDRVLPRRLGILAIGSAGLWVIVSVVYSALTVAALRSMLTPPFNRAPRFESWLIWVGAAQGVGQSIFYASSAVLVVLFVWRRWPTND